jgi:hypothetical protein
MHIPTKMKRLFFTWKIIREKNSVKIRDIDDALLLVEKRQLVTIRLSGS